MAGFFKKVFSFADKTDEENAGQAPALTPFEAHQLALKQAQEEKEAQKAASEHVSHHANEDTPKAEAESQSDSSSSKSDTTLDKTADNKLDETFATIAQDNIVPATIDTSLLVDEPEAADIVNAFPPQELPKKTGRISVGADIEEVIEPEVVVVEEPVAVKRSWFERLRNGLSRSSRQLGDSIGAIFTKRKLDEDTLQDLEDVLIASDLGLETAMRVTDSLASGRYGKDISTDEVRVIMRDEIEKVLAPVAKPLELDLSHKPHVILVVGVNGTGKTTTIGKLAAKLSRGGLKVMLAAGDTFRAAAIEQLHIWGKRTNSPVVATKLGADAASLAFEAYEKAREAGSDVLIIDTAGRLQNKTELMDELAKIVRVLGKHDADAPHTVLQTLDATTGQNALNQVEIFRNVAGVNGLVMTKLDGTARGGILVAIAAKHKLPVYFIGVGEDIDDLEPFKANEFAQAIAGKHD
ncbi:signal recognition particle-docking protein FtsY [Bartonella sp. HY329]|nr:MULTISPECIES: signal recognition particle-docking protein FtsY [unclassified Bartonella]UXM95067.1 signal recognition particle-docking protein FtsY [Bartonella sp. HY329]UXN09390.1 signal recognition particle-docking protein FtsY [Bartonella sp. HY328]